MDNILKIRVTRQDLKQSYLNPTNCPIATAIKRTYPKLGVLVGSATINLWDKVYDNGRETIRIHQYSIRPEDDIKAQMRGDGKLLGKILGGFTIVLHKIHWI